MSMQVYQPTDEMARKSSFEIMPFAFQLADKLSQTEFVPAGLRNRPAAIAAAILVGHEVGLPPMASLQHINVIEGKPTLDAASMRGLILSHGHRIWVEEQTITKATVCSQRRGEERVSSVTWTIDDAKRAQLSNKMNWQRYPRNMLVARATGDNARGNFMDVLAGIAYTTEEAQDMVEMPATTPDGQAQEPPPASKTRRATRAATASSEPPPPGPEPQPIESESMPGPQSEPPPAPDVAPVPEQPLAGEAAGGETLTLAQQIAMACRELGMERSTLIYAVTAKSSGRELTREQAVDVLEAARAIQRGEKRLVYRDDVWQLLPAAEAS